MELFRDTIQNVPIFRHFTPDEIDELINYGRIVKIKKGYSIDLSKINNFNVIVNGLFIFEVNGRNAVAYLTPGSFFGDVPMANVNNQGKIKAVMDSTYIVFELNDITRYFILNYKPFLSYIRLAKKMNFNISKIAREYLKNNSKIITVFGQTRESGKSFFSSLLGLSLVPHGKTVIIDMSYTGTSVFKFFEKEVLDPLSFKKEDESITENLLNKSLLRVTDDLYLLNISNNSKVKVNSKILSPILFLLSKKFNFIIMDLSNDDAELRDETFKISETIFVLLKNKKNKLNTYKILDDKIDEGQRIYYIINEFYSKRIKSFSGGFILKKFNFSLEDGIYYNLLTLTDRKLLDDIVELILKKKRALILQTNHLNAIHYAGFLDELKQSGISFDLYYTSSYSYIILILFLLSHDSRMFYDLIEDNFSDDKFYKLLNINFPDKFVYKKKSIYNFSKDICGDHRIEEFSQAPYALLCEGSNNSKRFFSTGFLREVVAASFQFYPIFEPVSIAGKEYTSGLPYKSTSLEDSIRFGIDDTIYVALNCHYNFELNNKKISNLFKNYIRMSDNTFHENNFSNLIDKKIVIDINEPNDKFEKIFENSKKISNKLLKNEFNA